MREKGWKPYISKTYKEMVSRKTNKEVWNAFLVKQSEYEKPYGGNTYEEMQHYFPPFPGFPPFAWGWDFPFDPFDPFDPLHLVFRCVNNDMCFCKGESKCFNLGCPYPIIGVEPTWPGMSGCDGLTFDFSGGQVCVTADNDPGWGCDIDILMAMTFRSGVHAGKTFYGKHSGIQVPECRDCEDCVPDPDMAWATATETIAQSSSLVVSITGLNTPFSWEVSGTGFTIDNPQTDGLSNTLRSDASACGAATITVTGCDGTVVTGYVRCVVGRWVSKGAGGICKISGAATGYHNRRSELIQGNKRMRETISHDYSCYPWDVPCGEGCGKFCITSYDCGLINGVGGWEGMSLFAGCCCEAYGAVLLYYAMEVDGRDYHEWEC